MELSLEGLLSASLSPSPHPPALWTKLPSVGGGPRGRVQGGWGVEQCPPLPARLLVGWWLVIGVGGVGDSWGGVGLGGKCDLGCGTLGV